MTNNNPALAELSSALLDYQEMLEEIKEVYNAQIDLVEEYLIKKSLIMEVLLKYLNK
jgi:hypothetical protein